MDYLVFPDFIFGNTEKSDTDVPADEPETKDIYSEIQPLQEKAMDRFCIEGGISYMCNILLTVLVVCLMIRLLDNYLEYIKKDIDR